VEWGNIRQGDKHVNPGFRGGIASQKEENRAEEGKGGAEGDLGGRGGDNRVVQGAWVGPA